MLRTTLACLFFANLAFALNVYLYPQPQSPLPSHLSPTEARIVVSHQLGLDGFDSLEELSNDEDLRKFVLSGSSDGLGEGPRKALLLSLSDEVAKDVVPEDWKPSFALPLSTQLSAGLVDSTIESFVHRAERVYTTIASSTSPPPTVPQLLDLFYLHPTAPGVEEFMSQTAQLVNIVESEDLDDVFGGFSLTGLALLYTEDHNSDMYKLGAQITRQMLTTASQDNRIALVLLTEGSTTLTRRQQQPPQSPFPPNQPTLAPQHPFSSLSTCYPSLDSCTNSTSSCSSHGSCQQASKPSFDGRTCFVCACNATKDGSGRTQLWVGDACERLDVSAPFALLAGTTIGIIILAAGSIALLSGIGSQRLPPTLVATAGAQLTKSD